MVVARLLIMLGGAAGFLAVGAAMAGEQPAWLPSAARFLPSGSVFGQVLRESPDQAIVAVFPADASDPAPPACAFAAGEMLGGPLGRAGDRPGATSGEIGVRDPALNDPATDPDVESSYAELQREIWIRGQQDYPSGTEACALGGWSIDRDPAGLPVHLKPDAASRVLGTLPAAYAFEAGSEAEESYFTEFDIVGYRGGWFLIEHAEPPGRPYADPDSYPDDHPEPFAGRGWIPAARVGAQFANGDMPVRARGEYDVPVGGLYQAPSVASAWTPAHDAFGSPISADGGPARILACSGFWALVTSDDGVTGWWRRLCSNQVTNCS